MSSAPAPTAPAGPVRAGRAPWVGAIVGVPIMGYGLRGVFVDAASTKPAELGRWLVGGALVHDLVLVPLVLVAGWVLHRVVRAGPTRSVLTWCLATSGVLALVAWPFVRGYGRQASNPSLLARDYARGLAVYIAVVWAVGAVVLVAETVRRRRSGPARSGRRAREAAPPASVEATPVVSDGV